MAKVTGQHHTSLEPYRKHMVWMMLGGYGSLPQDNPFYRSPSYYVTDIISLTKMIKARWRTIHGTQKDHAKHV